MKHPPAFQARHAAAQAAGDFDPWRAHRPPPAPRPGITRPLGGNPCSRLDDLQPQQHQNQHPLGCTTNHNPMKTKTIIAYRLTTNHKIVLRDLDGVRKAFQITRIERHPGVCSGRSRITTWFKDSFGSETPAVWSPRDRAEILS